MLGTFSSQEALSFRSAPRIGIFSWIQLLEEGQSTHFVFSVNQILREVRFANLSTLCMLKKLDLVMASDQKERGLWEREWVRSHESHLSLKFDSKYTYSNQKIQEIKNFNPTATVQCFFRWPVTAVFLLWCRRVGGRGISFSCPHLLTSLQQQKVPVTLCRFSVTTIFR